VGLTNWELHATLPATLSRQEAAAAYDFASPTSVHRGYRWNCWEFDVPPDVFLPGISSRLLHERLLDGRLPVAGRRYIAIGAGLGVEAVVAGVRGAASVHATDIHEESVRAAARHYARIVGDEGPPFVGVVSDLWDEVPRGEQFDVVTFNAPFMDHRLSNDPYVVRNRCMGSALAARFFHQLHSQRRLAPAGVCYVMVSNTERVRMIVAMALHAGFDVESLHVERRPVAATWEHTFLFAVTSRSPGTADVTNAPPNGCR
jgi:release factor glutamine methyltransferase